MQREKNIQGHLEKEKPGALHFQISKSIIKANIMKTV